MGRGLFWMAMWGAVGCGAADAPSDRPEVRDPTPASASTPMPEPEPEPDEEEAVHPLGSQYEEERRQALAGCVQTVSSELTGAVYAEHRFDAEGWPVESTLFSGDRVTSQVLTSYERVDGRVVSSLAETLVGAASPDTGCGEATAVTLTSYDEAQRPLEAVTTTTACGGDWTSVSTWEHFVENDRLVHTVRYEEGKKLQYSLFDKCAMVKRLDGVKYRNHYDGKCELQMVEQRRYKWVWQYVDLRPTRFTIEGNSNDTLYTYEGCLQ